MILPSKHLSERRALLSVGAEVLRQLDEPVTVSRLWEDMKSGHESTPSIRLSFDWFVLALDWLFMIKAIDLTDGLVSKLRSEP